MFKTSNFSLFRLKEKLQVPISDRPPTTIFMKNFIILQSRLPARFGNKIAFSMDYNFSSINDKNRNSAPSSFSSSISRGIQIGVGT